MTGAHLENFWKQEVIDSENGIDHGINNQDIDSRMLRMSAAAQVDLRPLFHVFGILPQNPSALQQAFDEGVIVPSQTIYNRLQDYFTLIPENNAAFVDYALSVYPNLYSDGPTATADYGVGWHYQKSLIYDTTEAQQRTNILQDILELYYPNGEPSNDIPDVCCLLDTMSIEIIDEQVIVIGGVEPYDIIIDIDGDTQTVTVTDFDNCQATEQFPILGVPQQGMQGIRVYPNPASTQIHIDVIDNSRKIETLQMISINGQVVKKYLNAERLLDVTALSKGIYILKIEMADGAQVNKKIIVFR